jgi:hypothetical protein
MGAVPRTEVVYVSLLKSFSRFARSPQGRRMAQQAMRYAQSPEGKRRIADARRRLAAGKGPKPR